jgi:hypothetical protein
VPVRVDHARHDDAARGVDDAGAVWGAEVRPDRFDPISRDENVGVREHRSGVVHRQHGAATQEHRVVHR